MDIQSIVEDVFEGKKPLENKASSEAVEAALAMLDKGEVRVAEKKDGRWQVNAWLKKAVLLSFRLRGNTVMEDSVQRWYDKVPLKYGDYTAADFERDKVRLVPGSVVRRGSYVAPGVVVMPSFVNIGAYVDTGCMIDTWATVGSCAQIGKNVHLSGGAGIGGVLEPLQATPTIIEDDCFIGARSEVVEGVVVEQGAVVSMGVFIGQSTPIYNRENGEISYGRVPAGSVVIAGNLPANDGTYSRYAAIIVKQADAKTRARVGLNALLRPDDL